MRGSCGPPSRFPSPASPSHAFQSGCVERVDQVAIAREDRASADAHPLARAVLVVRQVDVRIARELLELLALDVRHEPEIGSRGAPLRLHRTRDEMSVGAPRRHHRGLDAVDELVEIVELFLERDFVVAVFVDWRPCLGPQGIGVFDPPSRTFNAAIASATSIAWSGGFTFSNTLRDAAVGVDDERRTNDAPCTFGRTSTSAATRRTLGDPRVVVGEQRERQLIFLLELAMRLGRVRTDPEDHGVESLEPREKRRETNDASMVQPEVSSLG